MPNSLIGTSYITDLAWIQIRESFVYIDLHILAIGERPLSDFLVQIYKIVMENKNTHMETFDYQQVAYFAYLYA